MTLLSDVKEIIANPSEGVRKYVEKATWIRSIILVCVSYVISLVFSVIGYIKDNAEHAKMIRKWARQADMSVSKYCRTYDVDEVRYTFGEIFKLEFKSLLVTVIGVAITAAAIYLAIVLIGKAVVSWEQAFAIATIGLLVSIPCGLVTKVLGLIKTFALLSWIISAIGSFSFIVQMILLYLAVGSLVVDTKKWVYTLVIAYTTDSFVSSFVNYIIGKIFS